MDRKVKEEEPSVEIDVFGYLGLIQGFWNMCFV